jgi:hypothetical protein
MFKPIKIETVQALKDHVLVSDMNFKERKLSSGIYLLSDDGRGAGIRPRWAEVYATGPKQKDVQPGQWILVSHGRWTRGVTIEDQSGEHTIRKVDPKDILLVSDVEPEGDDTLSTATQIDSKDRW